jgi:aryl-alcohol dehydrogenase-like predicted oxidoreductase
MKYRSLGSSGLKVSVIGLGTNQFGGKVDEKTAEEILHGAMDLGVNLIDTADVYQEGRSEIAIGKALAGRRSQVLIATKFYFPTGSKGPNDRGASRLHIMNAAEASLRRLDTGYLDLYQIHVWDGETPIDETMRALDDLVSSGKVRYIGASNFSAWQLVLANKSAEGANQNPFVSIQPHYHLLEREIEKELIPACVHQNIGILPYFPLAGGFLTGKYAKGEPVPPGSRGESSEYVQRYMTDKNFNLVSQLAAFAEARNHTVNELAHAWLLAQPQISSVISGATVLRHVQDNAASGDWELSPAEVEEIDQILTERNV